MAKSAKILLTSRGPSSNVEVNVGSRNTVWCWYSSNFSSCLCCVRFRDSHFFRCQANTLSVVKWAIECQHNQTIKRIDLSGYYLAREISAVCGGMMIALPSKECRESRAALTSAATGKCPITRSQACLSLHDLTQLLRCIFCRVATLELSRAF